MKLGLIFNNKVRPDTTGSYFRKAYEESGQETIHMVPGESKFDDSCDWYLVIDDGIQFSWDILHGRNVAYYAIDTHLGYEERHEKAKLSRIVFVAQKNDCEKFKASGINAHWLPLGCDPDTHCGHVNGKKLYDTCFIGHVDSSFMQDRVDFLDTMFKAFPNFFYGQRYMGKAAEVYNESKIVLNRSVKNDINMRCFEVMASGSFLLTDHIKDSGFEKLFDADKHLVSYTDNDEAVEKVRYYLDHEDEREAIARAGMEHALANHTYLHRAKKILEVLCQ